MRIIDSAVLTKNGVCYVLGTEDQKQFTIQACLKPKKTGFGYVKIVVGDGGINEGICQQINKDALEKFGYEECLRIFKHEMRKHNIRFEKG